MSEELLDKGYVLVKELEQYKKLSQIVSEKSSHISNESEYGTYAKVSVRIPDEIRKLILDQCNEHIESLETELNKMMKDVKL